MSIKGRKRSLKSFFTVTSITSITLLNCLGISYAYWTGNVDINNEVQTGKLDLSFVGNYAPEQSPEDRGMQVLLEDNRTINVEGVVYKGSPAYLNYQIINKGTIPSKLLAMEQSQDEGLSLQPNAQPETILPSDNDLFQSPGPNLQIGGEKEGKYNFQLELTFGQFNK